MPHDTAIAINGNEVARLESMMPEGTYAFPVDPRWLSPGGRNVVSVSTTGMNGAHYLLANRFQIVAPVTDADRYVVATSQEEADRLYASLSSINHDRPDLAIVAKPNTGIPARPADGEDISFAVTAINLGEAPTPSARLRVLNYDPRERAASDDAGLSSLDAALGQFVLDRARLREVAPAVPIPALARHERVEVPVQFTFRTGETTRLYLVVETDGDDFEASNDVLPVTFISPEGESPLRGTDYPDLRMAPTVSAMVAIPAVPEVRTFTATAFANLLDRVPHLREIKGAASEWLFRVLVP